jgi:hypothetical protein
MMLYIFTVWYRGFGALFWLRKRSDDELAVNM